MPTKIFNHEFSACAPAVLAVVLTVCYCITVMVLCLVVVPESSRHAVDGMISLMGTVWSSLIAYLIGSRGLSSFQKSRAGRGRGQAA